MMAGRPPTYRAAAGPPPARRDCSSLPRRSFGCTAAASSRRPCCSAAGDVGTAEQLDALDICAHADLALAFAALVAWPEPTSTPRRRWGGLKRWAGVPRNGWLRRGWGEALHATGTTS